MIYISPLVSNRQNLYIEKNLPVCRSGSIFMDDMNFRTATEADIPQLQKLGLNAYGQFETVLTAENWTKLYTILQSEKKLMQLCEDHARQTGEKFIALHTSEFMEAARHIYESMGFVQIKELERRLGKMYWLYVKEL